MWAQLVALTLCLCVSAARAQITFSSPSPSSYAYFTSNYPFTLSGFTIGINVNAGFLMSRTSTAPPFLLNSLAYPVGNANVEADCRTSTFSGGVFVGLTNTSKYFVKNIDSSAPACANIGGDTQAATISNSEWIFITVSNGAFGLWRWGGATYSLAMSGSMGQFLNAPSGDYSALYFVQGTLNQWAIWGADIQGSFPTTVISTDTLSGLDVLWDMRCADLSGVNFPNIVNPSATTQVGTLVVVGPALTRLASSCPFSLPTTAPPTTAPPTTTTPPITTPPSTTPGATLPPSTTPQPTPSPPAVTTPPPTTSAAGAPTPPPTTPTTPPTTSTPPATTPPPPTTAPLAPPTSCPLPQPPGAVCVGNVWVVNGSVDLTNFTISSPIEVTGNLTLGGVTVIVLSGGNAPPVTAGVVSVGGELVIEVDTLPTDGQVVPIVQANGTTGNFTDVTIVGRYSGANCDALKGIAQANTAGLSVLLSVEQKAKCKKHGLSTGAIIAICVVVGIILIAIAVLITLICLRRFRGANFLFQETRGEDWNFR